MNQCAFIFIALTLATVAGNMHPRHPRIPRGCSITEPTIQQTLDNPCNHGHAPRRAPRHAMEPANVCFLQEGRVISSLQAMLSKFRHDYRLTRYDLQLLASIEVGLPTRLWRTSNKTEYARAMRSYYRELSCFVYAMDRSEVSMSRARHQRMCTVVSNYLKPMLCVGNDAEEAAVYVDCSDWTSLIPDEIGLYGYKVVQYFERFLQTLQPACRVTLPM